MMKAIILEDFGGPEKLKIGDYPIPEPGPNEVQIKVAYAAVNPVDCKIRQGQLKDVFPNAFPLILGWDASGTISAIGAYVEDYKIGDEVLGYCRQSEVKWGTYAEYTCAPINAIALKPPSITFAQAAAMPIAALTAWQALFEQAQIQKGQSILIQGGAGGVGSFAIQFAKQAGAYIYTTASQNNHDYVKSLGADVAIDYRQENVEKKLKELEPQGVDIVLDLVGDQVLKDSFSLVKSGGYLISIVEIPDTTFAQGAEIRTGYLFTHPDSPTLKHIAELMSTGKIKPVRIEEMPLELASQAHQKSEQGHVVGKIVLKVSSCLI